MTKSATMSASSADESFRYLNDPDTNNSINGPSIKPASSPSVNDDDGVNDDDTVVAGVGRCCGGCHLPPWRVLVTVIACTLVQATLGLSYMRGNMMPYTTSYLRNVTGETSLVYSDMLWLGNSDWIAFSAAVPILGLVQKKMSNHQRLYIFMGICLHVASHLGSFWGVKTSYGMLIGFNGVMAGIALAVLHPACLAVAIQWFPRHGGLVGGITTAGIGVGAFVWNQVITLWINPDNLQPDLTEGENLYFTQSTLLDRVPTCYLMLGGILTVVQFVCLALITFPPTDVAKKQRLSQKQPCVDQPETAFDGVIENVPESRDVAEKSQGQGQTKLDAVEEGKRREACGAEVCLQQAPFENDGKDEGLAEKIRNSERKDYGPRQILKAPVTWMLYMNALTVDLAFIFIVSFYKTYGQTFIHNDHLLSLVGSLASVFNAAGRPVWGIIADRMGFLPALLLTETVLVVSSATFVASEMVESSTMFFIWVCLMYESTGGVFALQGPTISSLFGFKYFVFSYGLITSTGLVTYFVSVALTDYLLPLYGWRSVYYAAAISVAFGVLVTVPVMINCGKRTCIPQHLQDRLMDTPRKRRAK